MTLYRVVRPAGAPVGGPAQPGTFEQPSTPLAETTWVCEAEFDDAGNIVVPTNEEGDELAPWRWNTDAGCFPARLPGMKPVTTLAELEAAVAEDKFATGDELEIVEE